MAKVKEDQMNRRIDTVNNEQEKNFAELRTQLHS